AYSLSMRQSVHVTEAFGNGVFWMILRFICATCVLKKLSAIPWDFFSPVTAGILSFSMNV
ncbi:hypothetical protein, partial [Saccharophagus degradans]